MVKMTGMMDALRRSYPAALGGHTIVKVTDYKTRKTVELATGEESPVTLPVSNVIVMEADNRDKIVVRPAGTEPKLKIYTMVQGKTADDAAAQTDAYAKDITAVLGIEG